MLDALCFIFYDSWKLLRGAANVFNAEAAELEPSWDAGSGLPICCISGSAVAGAGKGGDGMRGPGGGGGLRLPTFFFGTIIGFFLRCMQETDVSTANKH